MRLRAELRVRNDDMIQARLKLGLSQSRLALQSGVSIRWIQMLEKLDYTGGAYQYQMAEKLAEELGLSIEVLYPEALEGVAFPSSIVRYHEKQGHELAADLMRLKSLPGMTDHSHELLALADEQMDTLTVRQREVIKCRFGLDGRPALTYKELGEKFDVTRERIRQIEIRAMRILQARVGRYQRRQSLNDDIARRWARRRKREKR